MCLFIPGLLVSIGLVTLGFTAQVMVPTCGALFWKRSTVAGAFAGVIVGGGLNALCGLGIMAPPALFTGATGLFAFLCNVVVFIVVSLFTKPRPQKLMEELEQQYADYYNQVDMYED